MSNLINIPGKAENPSTSADNLLTAEIAKYYDDPLGYVMFMYPWDSDPSIQMVKLSPKYRERFGCEYGPDNWACEFLDQLGEEIKKRKFDGKNSVDPIKFATSSGHGIGKSTLVAWLIKFILDTRPFSKGVVTANTSEQLRTKTWAELAKWNGLSLSAHFWHYTSGRGSMSIYRRGPKRIQANWRCDAMTCREENAEAFQGLHAANSTPFYIFDEASGIPDKIFEARSGGATDGEPMIFDFGNPTRNSGMFYHNCIGEFKHRHIVRQIDSRDVAITNKRLIEEWKNDWGEDSDFFKVKVRGVFPSVGSIQFIPIDLVQDAMNRLVEQDRNAPLILGVDVARFGDNSTVLFPRMGNDARSFRFREFKGLDTVQVVERIVEFLQEFAKVGKKCSAIFVDGGGLGAGVVDMLRRLGYNPIDVNFGGKATDNKYYRKGDEMWGRMREALPRLAIPRDNNLFYQLTQREYGFMQNSGKIKLQNKEEMEIHPDIADALALTYASTIAEEMPQGMPTNIPLFVNSDYDLFGELHGSI